MREIRYRSMEEIMEEIREKARSYTPEWRFDQNDPDIGVDWHLDGVTPTLSEKDSKWASFASYCSERGIPT